VTEHGGTVTVGPHSDGNGTRFTVHFPLLAATHSPPSEAR